MEWSLTDEEFIAELSGSLNLPLIEVEEITEYQEELNLEG